MKTTCAPFVLAQAAAVGALALFEIETGTTTYLVRSDSTGITAAIVITCLLAVGSSWNAMWETGLHWAKANRRERVARSVAVIRFMASLAVMLGLFGTVVGFKAALASIGAGNIADPNALGPIMSAFMAGMATALNTTIIGTVGSLWLVVNAELLAVYASRRECDDV